MNNETQRGDLTQGGILKNIWVLALPMTIEMLMQSTFNIIDLFWVGRLGPEAIAAVSLAGVILMVYFSLIMGISVSSSAFVARRIGKKDSEGANYIIIQSIILGTLVSIVFGFIGFIGARFFIIRLGGTGGVIDRGTGYLRIMFAGSISIVLLFIINGIFRGVGDAVEAMQVLLIANVINLIFDPILIFGLGPFPRLGVRGAALATIFARACGLLLQIYILFRGVGRIRLSLDHFGIDWCIVWDIIRVGLPASGQILVRMLGMVVIMKIVALFGTIVIAAYGIVTRIFQFILFLGFGLGNAAATLVGQNLGAGNPKRAALSAWITGSVAMMMLACFAMLFYIFARPLIRIFNNDQEVIRIGINCLRIIAVSYLFNGLGVVLSRSFMGAGDTLSPFVINGLTLWLFQLPMAFLLARSLGFGASGIWLAITVTNILNVLFGAFWFWVGRWKKKRI